MKSESSPRAFLGSLVLALLAFALPTVAAQRLNVLFIAVDDLGNVLGPAGHPGLKTPHLDRLAATGVRFDRAYCQIPLCNPSRASVLTGLRPDATGVFDLDRHFRATVPAVVTLPQLFRSNGWFTARVGKIFHYDVPKGIGTDGLDDKPSWSQVVNPKGRDVADEQLITNPTPARPVSAALSWHAAEGSDEEQTDGMIAAEAIQLMEQRRGEAFFLGVGFFRPHTPFVAPKKYFEMYPLESIRLPVSPASDRVDIPPAAFAHNNASPNYGLDELTCRKALQAYYASVSFVDTQIGRVLGALDRLGLAERTLVVLWSDHGYHLGEHGGVWQKRTLFEESARAPLLIRAPGAKGNGRACPRIAEFVDIYPTVASLCGLTSLRNVAGRSLVPLLADPSRAWDGSAVTQILRPGNGTPFMGRSIRTERWRYTEWNEGTLGAELYDHVTDPQEFNNLARSAVAKEVVPVLQQQLKAKASGAVHKSAFNPARL
ncbi:MAG: iduronate-2-sulfatase [Pedosphaera sp. Tous-C6FEB]|nr:MAG: iduronate-2-sulfatase [Pedosphaera sp. Tous-C6FEB]